MIEEPLHWPEALTNLIDALADFIATDRVMGAQLYADRSITIEQYEQGLREIAAMERLLAKLKAIGPDPSLNGLRGKVQS